MPTLLPENKRYLSRRVVLDGVEHGLSIVEIVNGEANVIPFQCEIHSTVMLDGCLVIETEDGKVKKISQVI